MPTLPVKIANESILIFGEMAWANIKSIRNLKS